MHIKYRASNKAKCPRISFHYYEFWVYFFKRKQTLCAKWLLCLLSGYGHGKEGVKWKMRLANRRGCEEFLPIKLYCVIPTKQRQKDKSKLPTFIYNWTQSRRMEQAPSVRQSALAAGGMKYSNYCRLPRILMTGLQKNLTCLWGLHWKKRKLGSAVHEWTAQ